MSVLIKGMEMPKSCNTCELAAIEDISDGLAYECRALKEMIPNDKERLPNCPLVPVPPHGRLIEDTAVREQIDEWLDSVGDVVVGHGLSYYGELLGCIEDAPTIIPAEEGET